MPTKWQTRDFLFFWKSIKSGEVLFGQHQLLETEPNIRRRGRSYIVYQAQIRFSAKLVILLQQDAIGGKQAHQQEFLLRQNKIQSCGDSVLWWCGFTVKTFEEFILLFHEAPWRTPQNWANGLPEAARLLERTVIFHASSGCTSLPFSTALSPNLVMTSGFSCTVSRRTHESALDFEAQKFLESVCKRSESCCDGR